MKDARRTAQGLASLGRGEDSVLVHMTPGEVQGLQALAMAHGGSLTINPETGLAEAGFLKSLLPTIVGAALAGITGGWAIPMLAGAATGAVTGDKDQSLLMRAGLGALGGVGGANIYGGLAGIASTGAGAVGAGTIPGASSFTPLVEGAGQAAATEGAKVGALETMKQGAANLVKEGGFKAFTQAMPLGKFGLAAAAAPTIADMMQPPEYDVPESGSTKPKFYVGKDGQPLWRPGTYNPETGVFEGQGWNEGEYVSPYPGMEDEDRGFAGGGYIRRFADGGTTREMEGRGTEDLAYVNTGLTGNTSISGTTVGTSPYNLTPEQLAGIQSSLSGISSLANIYGGFNYNPYTAPVTSSASASSPIAPSTGIVPYSLNLDQLAQINSALGEVPNWNLSGLTGFTGQTPGTQTPGTQTPGTQTPGTQTPGTQTPSYRTLPESFYNLTAAQGPKSAWEWLRSNTQGLTLPRSWDDMSKGEKNEWLLENHPGLDAARFEAARDAYRSGQPGTGTTGTGTTGTGTTGTGTTGTGTTGTGTTPAPSYYYRDPSTGQYKAYTGNPSSATMPLYSLAGGDYYPLYNRWEEKLPDTMRDYYRGLFTPEGSLPAPRSAAPLAQYMADVNARLAKPYVPPAPPKSPLAGDVSKMGGFTINPFTGGMMFIPSGTTIPEAALKAGDGTVAGITGEDWMNFIKNLSSGGKDTTEGGEDTLEGGNKEPYVPPALANNFYDLIRTQGQSQAFAWLRQNIGNYDKLPSGWSNMTTGEKNLWLKQNYPGIDKAAFDAAQAAYVRGQQSSGDTGGAGSQPPTRKELWSSFWSSLDNNQKKLWSQNKRTPTALGLRPEQKSAWGAWQKALKGNYAGGQIHSYAQGGGIGSLRTYAAGGKLLNGPGDGMSDSIPAVIQGPQMQPAALADGEFVVPADVVSHLGNGSTNAGAQRLYSMMDKVRQARTGRQSQAPQINPNKYLA